MRRILLIVLALTLVTGATYWQVNRHEFINYDDPDYVTENSRVQKGITAEGIVWAFAHLHAEKTYWHPLTWISHMADCQLFGLNAGAHHLVNVLFHAINAVVLFLLLNRMTGALWRSAVVAALFALHPLQVDTVAWITERKNVLSTLFWMLTLTAYVRYVERPGPARYSLVFLLYVCGLMAKPPALVTLPCALLLLDFWPLARLRLFKGQPHGQTGGAPISHQPASLPGCSIGWLLLEKLPLFLLAAGAAAVTVFAHRGLGMGSYAVHRLPFLLRVENAFVSYARYLGKAVWPAKLCVLYPHPGVWPAWQVAASVALFAAVTGGVIRAARGQPWLFVGWFWFVGTLVPVIGLIQVGVQAMADRFAYVSLIGLFVLVVWGAADLAQRWRIGNGIRGAAAGVALVSCIVTTSLQLRHWENSITLFEHATRVTTNSFVAHNNLSMALLRANRPDEAEVHIREALRILPKAAEARFQLGVVSDIKGRSEQAVENYREAARLKPDWPAPKALLGTALYRQGLTNEAIVQFSAVLKLIPDDAETHSYLGLLLSGQGRVAEAIDHYRAALQTRPDWPEALNNLAWIFATNPKSEVRNGPDAVRLAGRACELAGRREAVFLGTLAAAYAEAGRFEDAARTAREAIDLASSRGQKDLAATNARLLELYRAGKPFREEGP